MARGQSGRLVIEVDPILKRDLHSALAADGLTLKDWFLHRADEYLVERRQPSLPGITRLYPISDEETLRAAEEPGKYGRRRTRKR